MPQKLPFIAVLTLLAAAPGLTACNREPEAPARMTDDDLDRVVTARINSDVTLASYNIEVDADASNNSVTLTGSVPAQSLRNKAVDAARTAEPGLIVTDKIDVKPGDVERRDYNEDMAQEARARATQSGETVGASLDDAWIHTKIRSKLMADGEFPGGSINVDVDNNVVTLRGSVATAAEKQRAEETAKETDGVKSVRNQLTVKPAS